MSSETERSERPGEFIRPIAGFAPSESWVRTMRKQLRLRAYEGDVAAVAALHDFEEEFGDVALSPLPHWLEVRNWIVDNAKDRTVSCVQIMYGTGLINVWVEGSDGKPDDPAFTGCFNCLRLAADMFSGLIRTEFKLNNRAKSILGKQIILERTHGYTHSN